MPAAAEAGWPRAQAALCFTDAASNHPRRESLVTQVLPPQTGRLAVRRPPPTASRCVPYPAGVLPSDRAGLRTYCVRQRCFPVSPPLASPAGGWAGAQRGSAGPHPTPGGRESEEGGAGPLLTAPCSARPRSPGSCASMWTPGFGGGPGGRGGARRLLRVRAAVPLLVL